MIDVTVIRNKSDKIQSFVISGHAFFAKRGKDIVCAGVSAVSVGAINAVHAITGVTPLIEQKDDGFLSCEIPDKLPDDTYEKIQLLLEGMVVSLRTIEEEYGQHIKITFKKQEVE
ncbi:ribosomal-processing cysteine protease Prp [Cytobacillus praedii]|uniref:Ribosomal processing cysteine protease Prp n=1 Tax=Cytobacillus praedii TaxID=1742358 RepID=A0A4R1AWY6_9BACI|nr:ribosomal-processing cysteine protease Prp [Cytobacillus praedii]MED3571462.1 ribosomal-processing cysteine protease Prp [Cytobacillus praedii]TCJ02419.1 ribosomal-processing cysteine protease Prp [Cytobacillus praedii]